MNEYETLLGKVKGLNRELALSYISAFGQMQEAENGSDFGFHDGRCDALTDAKQLVEKIIEESPGKGGAVKLAAGATVDLWTGYRRQVQSLHQFGKDGVCVYFEPVEGIERNCSQAAIQ